MNKKIFSLLIFVFIFTLTFNLKAQDRVIHGRVTTFDSIPLIGVTVEVKSTKQQVLTDSLGNFSVPCNKKDKLKVFADGFYNQNVKLNGKIKYAAINLDIKRDSKTGKIYTDGYGYVADKDRLNAIASLDKSELDFSKYKDIYDLIKGRFSGVRIVNGEVIVRGNNTFGPQTTNAALIVVDGIPSNESALSNIPPEDVKSIDIIKDGGAAIYGSRGANGVVVIQTRHGSDDRKK